MPSEDWTRGAVCYEIFVRSFADSDSNGVGDFNGLTSRLDYVNDGNPATGKDLGASCIWLMPVAESPSYHGYDVADYYALDREYGTVEDFKRLVGEAHRRGIKVLVDMVLNHASSEHPSFKAALADTASPYRAWYRFSPTPLGKGPWGMDAWHKSPVRDEYYYGVFWSGMPDLNYETAAVREEAKKVATFWLREMGVDGFRLDAIPYLTEEGTCLSGCPGTHAYLREYAAHIDSVAPGAYTVGEAWGKVDTVLPYYPDQLTSYFAFELADSLVSGVRHGSAASILRGYLRLQDTMPPHRWSPLLSNHDGARVMTMLGGDMAKARLAATLLLTLPGLPFVYYGDEIGMTGDKPDPRLRTPMQWRPGHGTGFTAGTPWQNAQTDSQTTTVEAQDADPGSLLNLYRTLIHLRKSHDALAVGRLVPLSTGSATVTAYLRREGDRAVLVVANLGDTGHRSGAQRCRGRAAAGQLPAPKFAWRTRRSGAASGRRRERAGLSATTGRACFEIELGTGPHQAMSSLCRSVLTTDVTDKDRLFHSPSAILVWNLESWFGWGQIRGSSV
jgi:glycosidase